MKRLLVTGAGGFLGWHVCRLAIASWETFGVVRNPAAVAAGCETVGLDLIDFKRLAFLFSDLAPDAVIHTAAAADPNACERRPAATEPINVAVPRLLAECCAKRDIPFLFTSTDLVFNGTRPPYKEDATPSPVNIYGRQKARAEAAVQRAYPEALICRLPLLYGWSGSIHRAFDHAIFKAVKRQTTLPLFTDEFRNPADASSVAAGMLQLLGKTSRVVHMGGKERVSRHEMGVRIARILKRPPVSLVPVRRRDVPMPAARPPDVCLVSDRAWGLGYEPLPLDQGIREALARQNG